MKFVTNFKKRKFLLFNIFLTLYVAINLVGGDRGLISYFEKKNTFHKLIQKDKALSTELTKLNHQILLINKNNIDYLDTLYRQKFNYVSKDEIIIKLK